MVTKKSNFTLLELMICIAILTIAGSFFAFKISEVLVLTKTNKSIKAIHSHVELCKRLSAQQYSDIILSLKRKNDKLVCLIGTEGEQGIYGNGSPLEQTFEGINFLFVTANSTEISDSIEFSFSSTGTVVPNGTLTLIGPKNKVKRDFTISNKYITEAIPMPTHPKDAKTFQEKEKPIQVEKI